MKAKEEITIEDIEALPQSELDALTTVDPETGVKSITIELDNGAKYLYTVDKDGKKDLTLIGE